VNGDIRQPTIRRRIISATDGDVAIEILPVDDVIPWNTHGEITEATIANVVVEIGGERWTPPRTCGLLPARLAGQRGARSP